MYSYDGEQVGALKTPFRDLTHQPFRQLKLILVDKTVLTRLMSWLMARNGKVW
jgi:hypothetical protein